MDTFTTHELHILYCAGGGLGFTRAQIAAELARRS